MTSGYTNYLINKEQEKLEALYNNPDFLNPVKLQPHLTHEEILMELVSNDDLPKTISSKSEDVFIDAEGVSSQQMFSTKLPNSYKQLKNNFVEFELFDITRNCCCDCLSNISVHIGDSDKNIEYECILKLGGMVAYSVPLYNHAELLKFPNMLLLLNSIDTHTISIRCKNDNSSIYDTNFIIKYDAIYLDNYTRHRSKNKSYNFLTPDDVVIMYMNGRYGVRYITQLLDTVSPQFKFLYSSKEEEELEPCEIII